MRKDRGYGEKMGGMEPKKIYCTGDSFSMKKILNFWQWIMPP